MTNKINKELIGAIKQNNAFIRGQKRQNLPFIIKWVCPLCNTDNEINYVDDYISSPTFGQEEIEDLCCSNCDYHGTVIFKPDITIEIIGVYDNEDAA